MLYALAAAVAWGVLCGLFRAPFAAVVLGGLAAAGLALWLEWESLGGREANRRPNFHPLLAAAYVFLAIIGVGIVSLGYFLGEWGLFQLRRL
jgi:hypothetical protein